MVNINKNTIYLWPGAQANKAYGSYSISIEGLLQKAALWPMAMWLYDLCGVRDFSRGLQQV